MSVPNLTADMVQPVVAALDGQGVTVQPGWRLNPIGHTLQPRPGGLYKITGQAVTERADDPVGWTAS